MNEADVIEGLAVERAKALSSPEVPATTSSPAQATTTSISPPGLFVLAEVLTVGADDIGLAQR